MATATATKAKNNKTNGATPPVQEHHGSIMIPIKDIQLSQLVPQQQRRSHFRKEDLTELSESIRDKGLINPITVRTWSMRAIDTPKGADYTPTYELVAGERRLLATQLAGYTEIEAIPRKLTDEQALEVQLHENLKRVDVEPLDEAFSYKYLIDECKLHESGVDRPYTVQDIAARFAKTEEIVLRRLKLIDLCDQGKKDLAEGFLPLAHAELLARFPEETQENLLKKEVYRPLMWDDKSKDPRTGGTYSIKNLQEKVVEDNAKRIIASAKFDPADPTLRADGLVCAACPKRTGYSPKLFADTSLGNKDTCLDGKCWDGKLRAMLTQKREKIAAELPNPKNKPLKEQVLLVPMLKKDASDYSGHRDMTLGKGIYLKIEYSRKPYVCVKKGECEFVEKALRIGGNLGATTLICRTKACPKHKIKEQAKSNNSSYDYEADRLKREEGKLQVAVADAVRVPLVTKKVQQFSESKWIFDNDQGRRFLLTTILDECSNDNFEEFEALYPKAIAEVRGNNHRDAVAKLNASEVSQMLALFCFGGFGQSGWSDLGGDQGPVKQLAQEFGDNYALLDAEARLALYPETHHAAALAHLNAVESGKASKPPTVHWPRVAAKPEAKPKSTSKGKAAKTKGGK